MSVEQSKRKRGFSWRDGFTVGVLIAVLAAHWLNVPVYADETFWSDFQVAWTSQLAAIALTAALLWWASHHVHSRFGAKPPRWWARFFWGVSGLVGGATLVFAGLWLLEFQRRGVI